MIPIPEIPAMTELETDRSVDFLAKHAQLENTRSQTAVNESIAELQKANAKLVCGQAKRAIAVAGLLRTLTFLVLALGTGWSVFFWVAR